MNNWQSISVEISYSDFSSICRICFAKNNLRALQEVEFLNDILQNITNTKITFDDGLPQSICIGCIKKLKDISDFISLSLKLNITSVCRICLATDNLKAIKEVEYLIDVLQSLTDTKIAFDDDLPQNICIDCIKKLEDISDFIDLSVYNITCLKNVCLTRNAIKTNTVNWISNSGTDNDFTKIIENDGIFTNVTEAANNKSDEVQGSDHGGSDSADSDFFYKDTASTSLQETSEVVNKSDKVQGSDGEDGNFFYPDKSDTNETSQKDKSQKTRKTKRTPNYSYKFYQSKEKNRENQKKHRRKMLQENGKLLETLTGVEKKNESLKEQIKDLRDQKHKLGMAILELLKDCSA